MRETIELGTRQGFSQARIELSPASLGDIRIHLQRTDGGVVAHVVTEHAAAAQTLQQGGADLKRSLQSAGVNLIRLDIETRDQGNPHARSSEQFRSASSAQATDDQGEPADVAPAAPSTVVLPGGARVNVLA